MQTFLMIITLVSQLFPLVIQIVEQVEKSFPQGGQGAMKLKLVRDSLEAAFKSYSDAQVTFEQVWPMLQSVINGAVALRNAAGQFKKSVANS